MQTREQIERAVVQAIATQKMIEADSIQADSPLADLNISSLDVFAIAFELEEQFGVKVPNEALPEFVSVTSIVDRVLELSEAA